MRMIKKSVSVLLVLTMIVTLFTMIPIQASAETGQRVSYKYRFWDTNQVRECVTFQDNVQPLSSCQNNHSLSGWYYLDKSFEVGDRVTVSDEAHIILTVGYTATFKRGIRVASGKELNLYPNENNDNGKLIANGYDYGAAIGSNDEDDGDESSAGTINIYGGNITALGTSDAAGIGGGNEASGGTVRIYGGFVTANGGQYAAGIGGGDECSGGDIYVYGGTVKANGGQDGAGIGGGEDGSGGTYNQYGGRVTANGGKAPGTYDGGGAGIGGGEDGNQGTVNIYGGSLSAYCGSFGQGAGIGAGGNSGSGGDVNISGGSVYANGTYGAGIGGCQEGKNGTIRITGGTVKAVSEHAAGIGSGYGRFNDQGGDILIENASVEAIGNGYGAGIGGGSNDNKGGSGKNVTIRKSVVTVGSSFGAGIGGGGPRYGDDGGHGGNITIESSMVFAISKERGAGIGGGCGGDGGTIVIRDSFVEAYGGSSSYDYLEDRASVRKLFKGYTAQIYYKDNDINRDHPFETDGSFREVPVHFYYPENADGVYPLVVFSHGAFGYYQSNFSTYAELASNGYIVAALDHPHHSFFTKDTDGKIVTVDPDFINDVIKINEQTDDQTVYDLSQSWMKLRTDDENFVLDTIENAKSSGTIDNAWHTDEKDAVISVLSHTDTEKIGLIGHSLGGAASTDLGRKRNDVDTVIVLDGTMLGEVKGIKDGKNVYYDEPYPVPLLDFTKKKDYDLLKQYKNEHGYPYVNEYVDENALDSKIAIFDNAEHMDFTDLPMFSPFLGSMLGHGDVDSVKMMTDVNGVVLDWFNYYLKGEGVLDIQAQY